VANVGHAAGQLILQLSNRQAFAGRNQRCTVAEAGSDIAFERNLVTRTTFLVSVNSDGTASGNGNSNAPVISADGRVVAFESDATNLDPAKTVGNGSEVYARDLQTGTTYLVSSANLGHTQLVR
jgi:Tol biopolymer transport system component